MIKFDRYRRGKLPMVSLMGFEITDRYIYIYFVYNFYKRAR